RRSKRHSLGASRRRRHKHHRGHRAAQDLEGKVFERDTKNPNRGVLKNKILLLGHKAIEANVYKDKSWFDGKECIVLDYSETSLIAKKVRDEIREIEPGFYLGIVFWGKKRTIDFALEFPKS